MEIRLIIGLLALSASAQLITQPPSGSGSGGTGTVTQVICPNGTITTSGTCAPITGATTGSLVTANGATGLQTPTLTTGLVKSTSGVPSIAASGDVQPLSCGYGLTATGNVVLAGGAGACSTAPGDINVVTGSSVTFNNPSVKISNSSASSLALGDSTNQNGTLSITTNTTPAINILQESSGNYAQLVIGTTSQTYQIGVGGSAVGGQLANSLFIYDQTAGAARLVLSNGGVFTNNGPSVLGGGVTMVAAAPSVAASQVGIGATFAAASNCGSLATKCWVINDGGTPRYVPAY